MKSPITFIKYLHNETLIGRMFLSPIKFISDYLQFNRYSDIKFIEEHFQQKLNYKLNLKNPQTFNEKLQWLKIHHRTPLHTKCADKLAVRSIVQEKIGSEYLIPLLYHTADITELSIDKIPNIPCIIKTNHDSDNVFIIRERDTIDLLSIQQKLKTSMRYNYYHSSREWQYKHIKPTILIEKLILDSNNLIPKDYKIHCFHGQPLYIQVDSDRFNDHKRTLYDIHWNEKTFAYKHPILKNIEQPKNLNLMLELAKKLSQPFPFARIDFYDTGKQVYFGEITFCPESGFGNFIPNKIDNELGQLLKLPLK